ncbi:MAG: polysaccharide deacetylase family protein [Clostridiales bacterium]|mgnify:CR=1 FL=1|nr:polysaccharide deacetylase family protein [Clostridiales bacterium]HBM81148.1 hypothetical protein [Clostridiaceae bacterium]
MINLILNNIIKNNFSIHIKRVIYTFFYLTEGYNDDVCVSDGYKRGCINIYYGTEPVGSKFIYIPREETKGAVLYFHRYGNYLFASFLRDIDEPFSKINGNIYFKFDILSVSFFLISCKEEYIIKKRDAIGRFLADYSMRKDKITFPFFDAHSRILLDSIKMLYQQLNLSNEHFRILLTHDVDSVNSRNKYVFLHNAKELLYDNNISFAKRFDTLTRSIIYNTHFQFRNYMNIESKRGVKSEFYFIEGRKNRKGKRYELSDIIQDIRLIEDNGCIIGIHTNYFSYDNVENIKKEIMSIEKATDIKVKSGRNHYLRFDIPNSWNVLRKAGIMFDSTLGYSDHNGFRAATARPFLPYDVNNDNIIDIYEIPLVIMDGNIMDKNIPFDEKWRRIKIVIDLICEYRGTSAILWHNYVLGDPDYKNMYIKILDYILYKGGQCILSRELKSDMLYQKRKIDELMSMVGGNK